jgi:SAM-dependent methyltransferase
MFALPGSLLAAVRDSCESRWNLDLTALPPALRWAARGPGAAFAAAVEAIDEMDEDVHGFFDAPEPGFPDLRPLLRPGARVLDLGCGHGRNLESLRAQGFRALGLDASAERLTQAQARGDGAAPLVRADLFELPFGSGAADAILIWQVVCAFPQSRLRAVFAEAARVLAPEGLLVLAGCCAGCERGPWEQASAGRCEPSPLLSPDFIPVRAATLAPVTSWPRARWLTIARKAAPVGDREGARDAAA